MGVELIVDISSTCATSERTSSTWPSERGAMASSVYLVALRRVAAAAAAFTYITYPVRLRIVELGLVICDRYWIFSCSLFSRYAALQVDSVTSFGPFYLRRSRQVYKSSVSSFFLSAKSFWMFRHFGIFDFSDNGRVSLNFWMFQHFGISDSSDNATLAS